MYTVLPARRHARPCDLSFSPIRVKTSRVHLDRGAHDRVAGLVQRQDGQVEGPPALRHLRVRTDRRIDLVGDASCFPGPGAAQPVASTVAAMAAASANGSLLTSSIVAFVSSMPTSTRTASTVLRGRSFGRRRLCLRSVDGPIRNRNSEKCVVFPLRIPTQGGEDQNFLPTSHLSMLHCKNFPAIYKGLHFLCLCSEWSPLYFANK